MILGQDTLRKIGLKEDFAGNVMTWDDAVIFMKQFPTNTASNPTFAEMLLYEVMEEDLDNNPQDQFLTSQQEQHAAAKGYKSKIILSSKYEEVDIQDIARKCTHLPLHQQNELKQILRQYPTLFSGDLGVYPHEQVHLDIDPSVPTHRSHAYPVAHSQLSLFKEELD